MKKLYEDDPIKAAENPAYYYFQIMNLLDEVALANRELTAEEIKALDYLMSKDELNIGEPDDNPILDIADANDCYTEDDELCSTWDEMVIALRNNFISGDRIHNYSNEITEENYTYGKEYLASAQQDISNGNCVTSIFNFGDKPYDISIEIQREDDSLWLIIDDNRNPNNLMRGNAEFTVLEFLTLNREKFDKTINDILENDMFPDPE